MIKKVLKNKFIFLSLLFILLTGIYLYINYNVSLKDSLATLVKTNQVHIFDGYVLRKINTSTQSFQDQYEIQVISSYDNVKGKVVISIPSATSLKIDKYSKRFIGVYDSKNKWYDTIQFQHVYHFNAIIVDKIGSKKIDGVNAIRYQVKITDNESTSMSLNGVLILNGFDSTTILEKGKNYSFFVVRDLSINEFIIISTGEAISFDSYLNI